MLYINAKNRPPFYKTTLITFLTLKVKVKIFFSSIEMHSLSAERASFVIPANLANTLQIKPYYFFK